MNRRNFAKTFSGSALSLFTLNRARAASYSKKKKLIKPPPLRKGATVGLITPGSYISDDELEKAVRNMEDLGMQVKMGKHIRAERGFIAGTDAQRLEDLHAMFADDQVAAVWCARGGYGCSRLLPYINYKIIRKNPKIIIGYSDVTALLMSIHRETGLVCFHGPNGGSEFTDYTREQIIRLLMERRGPHDIFPASANLKKEDPIYAPSVISPGRASGPLAGGNLSLLAALAGTKHGLDAAGKLVFIEDIGEKPYRIDRMLTQLRQSGRLGEAAGIALGVFVDCQPDPEDRSLSLLDTLRDRLGDLEIPVVYGLSFGHIDNQCILPLGLKAEMDTHKMTIRLLEAGVS